jgi:uncharacterized protein (TIGR02596 family)
MNLTFRQLSFRSGRAFTLMELLLVITVIVILSGMIGWGFFGSIGSQKLSTNATKVANDISYGVQYAVKSNRALSIRFYRYTPADVPGAVPEFRAYQMLVTNPKTGKQEPLDKMTVLDPGVVFLNTAEHSSLLTKLPGYPTAYDATLDPDLGVGNYDYVAFQIRPDGSTTLGKMAGDNWAITLVKENPAGATIALTPDFRTVVINPATGAVRIY